MLSPSQSLDRSRGTGCAARSRVAERRRKKLIVLDRIKEKTASLLGAAVWGSRHARGGGGMGGGRCSTRDSLGRFRSLGPPEIYAI
jgi:hypothetical protein